jgi:O-antigen ligase
MWLTLMAVMSYLSASFLARACPKLLSVFIIFCAACIGQVALVVWQYSSGVGFHPLSDIVPTLGLLGQGGGKIISGTFFAKNALAGVLQISTFVLLGLAVWGRIPVWFKLLCTWGSVACGLGVAFSGSRAGVVGLIAGGGAFFIASFFIISRAYYPPRRVVSLVAAGVALAPCIVLALLYYRSFDFFLLSQRLWADPYRENLWHNIAPSIYSINPWFGTGANSFSLLSLKYRTGVFWGEHVYAHNDWLQLLLDYGIVGLFFGILFTLAHLAGGLRGIICLSECSTDSPTLPQGLRLGLLSGSVGAIVATLCHAFFDYNLHSPAIVLPLCACFGVCSTGWRRMPGEHIIDTRQSYALVQSIRAILIILGMLAVFSAFLRVQIELSVLRMDIAHKTENTEKVETVIRQWDRPELTHSRFLEFSGRHYLREGLRGRGIDLRLAYFQKGADFYRRSLAGRPNDPRLMRNLALCLDFLGMGSDAKALHLRALALDPLNGESYEYLAAHFFLLGRRDEAYRLLNIARTKPGGLGVKIFTEK